MSERQNGIVVSNRYDEMLPLTNAAVVVNGSVVASTGSNHDTAGRLTTVTDGANSATYSYIANSPLAEQILFKQSETTRMATTKSFDYLNRLTQISFTPSADTAAVFNYANNSATRRTSITNADGSRWEYAYDTLGQVTSGRKYWTDGISVPGQQFDYAFDDIGNRKTAASGGDASDNHKRLQTCSPNTHRWRCPCPLERIVVACVNRR